MTKHHLVCDSCEAEYFIVHELDDYYEPSQCPFCGHEVIEIQTEEDDD